MSKPESNNNNWDSFESALAMFEPIFTITREQGTQEIRERITVFAELDASFATDEVAKAAAGVKKPL